MAFAWGTKRSGDPKTEEVFSGCGGGKAPGGLCGAVLASCLLAGERAAETIKQAFAVETGGHLTCGEIRATKKLPCSECVGLAAELLETHTGAGMGSTLR